MQRFLSATFLALAILFQPSALFGQSPPQCMTEPEIRAKAATINSRADVLNAAQSGRAIAIYDSIPPSAHSGTTAAILVSTPDGAGHLIVGRDGQFCASVAIPAQAWRAVLELVIGMDA